MPRSKNATAKDPSLSFNFFIFTKETVNIIKHNHQTYTQLFFG